MRKCTSNGSGIKKAGWKCTDAVMARRKIILSTRKALMEAGFDDTRISEVISMQVGLKPETVIARIKEQVRKRQMEQNPNNRKADLSAAESPQAGQMTASAQPSRSASVAEELIRKLAAMKEEFERGMRKAREEMGKPVRQPMP